MTRERCACVMAASTNMTPEQRSLRARVAAHHQWATTEDRAARTAAARRAADDRFHRLADPDGVLTVEQRGQRAESLRKAHYSAMALRSAAARRRRSDGV